MTIPNCQLTLLTVSHSVTLFNLYVAIYVNEIRVKLKAKL